jgi:chemotaxis protein MotB
MVTYADMVTLVLVFFILLFSMSQIDQARFEAVAQSFQDRMILEFMPSAIPFDYPEGDSDEGEEGDDGEEDEMEPSDPMKNLGEQDEDDESEGEELQVEERLEILLSRITSYLEEQDLENYVTATKTEAGVNLALQESILFDSGEAFILDEGEELLTEIASLLSDIPNDVRVEGHTDSRPISNFRYPSNWELSGARASSVVRYFVDQEELSADRFSSVGYAETRPVAENTPENFWENRRVEIVILDSGGDHIDRLKEE